MSRLQDDLHAFLDRRRPSPAHVHRCPECHDDEPCGMNCTLEPDLELENGTPRGSFVVCSQCKGWTT